MKTEVPLLLTAEKWGETSFFLLRSQFLILALELKCNRSPKSVLYEQELGTVFHVFWTRYCDVKRKTGEHLAQEKRITLEGLKR